MTFSHLFTITIIQRQITWKWYNIQLYLQWLTNRKSNMIYQPAPLSMTLNDAYRSFKVMPFFDTEYLRNGMTYRHCFNEILVATYTHPTQQCNFEWPWVTWQNIQWRFVSDAKRHAFSLRQLSILSILAFSSLKIFIQISISIFSTLYFPLTHFQHPIVV